MSLVICGNFLIYLFFCASTEAQVARAYDMLQRYHDMLRSLADKADCTNISLIRPALVRAGSFFHGAAEGIRVSSGLE
jgi:hypothetical protein